MQRSVLSSAVMILCASWLVAAERDEQQQRRERFFEARVRPLLIAECYECHSDRKQESGLRLDSRAAVLRGGDNGPAVVGRDLEKSLLIQAVMNEGLEMPPDEPLTEEQVDVLARWVKMGMPWPEEDAPAAAALGDQEAIGKLASKHWAFQSIRQPPVPSDDNSDMPVNNPIDRFINAQIAQQHLTPAPRADRRTLIRRAAFDVTGLPPTPAQVEAFVNDPANDDDAFATVVDRLLESKHYGERWGRYWLDMARYADTQDWQAQADVRYPFAYTYRDYVINALNDDKPYDQFIRQQLAADTMGLGEDATELAALGFLAVGPRFRNNRLEQAADQIDVITRGLMGLTVTCARCHDHKYDPIPIEDYYSLYAVVASCEVPKDHPEIAGSSVATPQRADFDRQLAKATKAKEAYCEKLQQDAIAKLSSDCKPYFLGFYDMHVGSNKQIREVISRRKIEHTAMTPLAADLNKLTSRKALARDPVWQPWVSALQKSEKDFAAQRDQWLASFSGKSSRVNAIVRAAITKADPKTRLQLIETYADVFQQVLDAWNKRLKQSPDATALADADQEQIRRALLGDEGVFRLDESAVVAASRLLGAGRRKLGDLEKAIGEVYVTHPGAPPKAMVIQDKDKPINAYVMLRGEPARRGDKVEPRFVSIVTGPDAEPFRNGSGRAELAEQIVSPTNPLTSRVIVNRVWSKYFGRGIVDSADDFGLRSPSPTHPELLDWLASELIANQWSLKWLHRTILSSAAYQRTSQASGDADERDPENLWLSHQNRKRLDFEALRDSILAVSGRLDPAVGGRSFQLSEQPYSNRRTVYAYIDRVEMDPMLRVFDFATPTTSTAQRAITTVPQQSLFIMNHPFVIQCARDLAAAVRPTQQTGEALDAAIEAMYRRTLGRPASDQDKQMVREFLKQADNSQSRKQPPVWSYGVGDIERSEHDFEPLSHWSGQQYQRGPVIPDPVWGHAKLSATGGSTPRLRSKAVIRRWTSPIDGKVVVTGKLKHLRDKGDGVIGKIASEAIADAPQWKVFDKEVTTTVKAFDVRVGTVIDFMVEPGENASNDIFAWAPVITSVDGSAKGQSWNARQDFSPPPVPPLDGWQQLAQALMLTNEFIYLD